MRQTVLKDWGQPQAYSFASPEEELDLADELGDFGTPVEEESQIWAVLSDIILKLSMLIVLLLCIGTMAFCIYRLSGQLMPTLRQVICEAPPAPKAG